MEETKIFKKDELFYTLQTDAEEKNDSENVPDEKEILEDLTQVSIFDLNYQSDKKEKEDILFEEISPYSAYFWTGQGYYNNQSIPTLYVGGYLNKEWVSSNILCKYGKETGIEQECYKLCLACNIPSAKIENIGYYR